jgi:hypothetical protein
VYHAIRCCEKFHSNSYRCKTAAWATSDSKTCPRWPGVDEKGVFLLSNTFLHSFSPRGEIRTRGSQGLACPNVEDTTSLFAYIYRDKSPSSFPFPSFNIIPSSSPSSTIQHHPAPSSNIQHRSTTSNIVQHHPTSFYLLRDPYPSSPHSSSSCVTSW